MEQRLVLTEADVLKKPVPGCGGQIFNIFTTKSTTLKEIELALCVFPPGETARRHAHKRMEEIYYIVRGIGSIELDGEDFPVGPGDSIAIPIGVRHRMRNIGDSDLVFLSVNSEGYDPQDIQSE